MNEQQMRDDFCVWALGQGFRPDALATPRPGSLYASQRLQEFWECWFAAACATLSRGSA